MRLLANPTVKKTVEKEGETKKARLGLLKEADQLAWLKRKLEAAGAELLGCQASPCGLQHSRKGAHKSPADQAHLAVLYEGVLQAADPARLRTALEAGLGPAKGFGFGLLSLALA